ncbi:family 43 glycosylhydrolase, partial [Streptomyces sp. SID7982]|nr:family 43 glycosylhydrolase [Streptomyces sp. SID7982]
MSDPTRKPLRSFRRSSALGALALTAALAATLFLSPPDTAQGAPPAREAAPQGQTSLRAADPSVLRVGSTYVGVQSTGGGIAVRQASSTDGLATAPARQVWADSRGRGEVWAPEIVMDGGRYYIYFTAGVGAAHRMFVISSASPDSG